MPFTEGPQVPPAMTGAALTRDATNRAARTAYVQLAIDVLVAVAMLVTTELTTATGWDSFNWKVLGFSLAKTVVSTIGSFILRRFVDASSVPTPLPPAPVPAPNEDNPEPDEPTEPDPDADDSTFNPTVTYPGEEDHDESSEPLIPEPELSLEVPDVPQGPVSAPTDEEAAGDGEHDEVDFQTGSEGDKAREFGLKSKPAYETDERSMEDKEGL